MKFKVVWKGSIPYLEGDKIQKSFKEKCLNQAGGFIIGFECPSVVTLGLRGEEAEDLLYPKQFYQKQNIDIIKIKRGGQATLHSPGQLVIYPVLNIKKNKIRVRDFIVFIEQATKNALKKLGVESQKEEGQAGLFTSKGKIAFFGLHVSDGVSQHGLAVNVKNDLSLFSSIRSCGKAKRPHDRVLDHCPKITLKKMFDLWVETALLGYSSVG